MLDVEESPTPLDQVRTEILALTCEMLALPSTGYVKLAGFHSRMTGKGLICRTCICELWLLRCVLYLPLLD